MDSNTLVVNMVVKKNPMYFSLYVVQAYDSATAKQ